MRKVVIRVCISCKKCQAKVIEHIRRLEGVKEVIDFQKAQKIEVIGDLNVDNILNIFQHCKLQKKFAIQSIEELPKPEPPKAPPEDKPKKPEDPPKKKKKEDPPPKKKEPKPEPEFHDHLPEPEFHDHLPEPEVHFPEIHFHDHLPEPEPEPFCPPPSTIIVHEPLPTCFPCQSSFQPPSSECVKEPCSSSSSMDLAILMGLVIVVAILLATTMSSSSSSGSISEALGTLFTGFLETTIATLGSLFLIILALFAVMGLLCLADPKPRPCSC